MAETIYLMSQKIHDWLITRITMGKFLNKTQNLKHIT